MTVDYATSIVIASDIHRVIIFKDDIKFNFYCTQQKSLVSTYSLDIHYKIINQTNGFYAPV